MDTINQNNTVKIGGVVASKPEFSHEIYDEKFYRFYIDVDRLSNSKDRLPVVISERLINLDNFEIGKLIYIEGQFRSYNQQNQGRNKLVLSIFVKEIELENLDESIRTLNEATFIGYICKKPIYRKTPLGREIADVLLAVNRSYKKSDYIPCILWGRNAKFCENLEIGTLVKLTGRIQARQYEKKLDNGTSRQMIAYEVSVSKFGCAESQQNNNGQNEENTDQNNQNEK